MSNRKTLVGLLLLVLVIGSAGGWLAAVAVGRNEAPVFVAPESEVVSVPVELRPLSRTVISRGDVVPSDTSNVGNGSLKGVITWLPKVGSEVENGSVIYEVDLRPIIAVAGILPTFRDILPNDSGDDVAQWQAMLRSRGYQSPLTGIFDSGTQEQTQLFYESIGYLTAPVGDERLAGLEAASGRVLNANVSWLQAIASLKSERLGPERTAMSRLASDIESDLRELESLSDSGTDADRQQLVEGIRENRQELAHLAARNVTPGAAGYILADRELELAEDNLATMKEKTGTWIPKNEVVVLDALPSLVSSLQAMKGTPPTDSVLTVASAQVLVRTLVTSAQAENLAVGLPALLHDEVSGNEFHGEIAAIESAGQNSPGGRVQVDVGLIDGLGVALVGANVRVTITLEATEEAVLVVPSAAVYSEASGEAFVLVWDPIEGSQRVGVSIGMTTSGEVEIMVSNDEIRAGDLVVVGG